MSYQFWSHARHGCRTTTRERDPFRILDPRSRPIQRVVAIAVFLSFALTGGCGGAGASRVWITPAPEQTIVAGFDRLLVAGFLVDQRRDVDINTETARFLRMGLRSKTSLRVVETEPILLSLPSPSDSPGVVGRETKPSPSPVKAGRSARQQDAEDTVFMNVPFWKKLGEEYESPLILTGRVVFRPPTELRLRLTLISGKTGEIIESANLRATVPSKPRSHTPVLTRYLQLMERIMPSILTALGQRTSQVRVLLR